MKLLPALLIGTLAGIVPTSAQTSGGGPSAQTSGGGGEVLGTSGTEGSGILILLRHNSLSTDEPTPAEIAKARRQEHDCKRVTLYLDTGVVHHRADGCLK